MKGQASCSTEIQILIFIQLHTDKLRPTQIS